MHTVTLVPYAVTHVSFWRRFSITARSGRRTRTVELKTFQRGSASGSPHHVIHRRRQRTVSGHPETHRKIFQRNLHQLQNQIRQLNRWMHNVIHLALTSQIEKKSTGHISENGLM